MLEKDIKSLYTEWTLRVEALRVEALRVEALRVEALQLTYEFVQFYRTIMTIV
jgi:hypothetical protein